jgi:arylsulfatase A-like enzyme
MDERPDPGDATPDRRRFLKTLGAISATAIAGCLGGDADEDTPTDTPTAGETPTDTPTGGDTPGATSTRTDTPEGTETDTATATPEPDSPNVIVIMADDMGYGDTSVEPFTDDKFGSPIPTPNLEEMAANGARFTSHYNGPAPVCTPTRAALMTGSYHARVGVGNHVYFPPDETGMHPDETTIADIVQAEGYATGMIGKWHLGDEDPYLPPNQGFDTYYGVPYSNDMDPFPLLEGVETIDEEAPNAQLTQRYTDQALQFIEDHQDEPFFLYLPHTMSHIPLGVSDGFQGETGMGTYPDVIHELDWSTGQILDRLAELGLEEDTLVVFTTDDGAWEDFAGQNAGSTGPLRASKGSTFEGGARAPTIMHWPGTIPEGTVCEEMTSHIDILPTVANLMGTDLPDNTIDGKDITPLLENPETETSPHDHILYYDSNKNLDGIRNADGFKYHFGADALYNLNEDIGEETDVSGDNPDLVSTLQEEATNFNSDLQDNARPEGSLSNIAYLSIDSASEQGAVVTFTNNTDTAVGDVEVSVSSPDDGWEATAQSSTSFDAVVPGNAVEIDVDLTADGSGDEEVFVHATATYQTADRERTTEAGEHLTLVNLSPLPDELSTFNNGSDDPAFGMVGDSFVIEGTGAVFEEDDAYTAIYEDGGLPLEGTVTTKVADVEQATQFSTGDLIIRNDVTQPGESPGYALLSVNQGRMELKTDTSSDGHIQGNEATTHDGGGLPKWLRFERSGTTFVASHSPDGSTWSEIATFELEEAADTMDVGMAVTSSTDENARVTFDEFNVS